MHGKNAAAASPHVVVPRLADRRGLSPEKPTRALRVSLNVLGIWHRGIRHGDVLRTTDAPWRRADATAYTT
jgi:hypothetical protein